MERRGAGGGAGSPGFRRGGGAAGGGGPARGGRDPPPAPPAPPRLDYEGGLGIPLIRLLADELEFRPSEGGTTVVMTFGPRVSTGRVGS